MKEYKKREIALRITIGILLPFIVMYMIGLLIKAMLFVGGVLPDWMIVFRIHSISDVSYSNFIYYYATFLAIEVTGILSYAVYKLAFKTEAREVALIRSKKASYYIAILSEVLVELRKNHKEYTLKRDNSNWSFKSIIEDEPRSQFGYNDRNQGFKFTKWHDNNGSLLVVLKDLDKADLFYRTCKVVELLEVIAEKTDVNQFDLSEYELFEVSFKSVIFEIMNIIEELSTSIKGEADED